MWSVPFKQAKSSTKLSKVNHSQPKINSFISVSGKWMYEVQIGTSGLMQIGWCTSTCKFNRDEGAGDTKHSYAYDGYREAKWTSRCNTKYGKVSEPDIVFLKI